ncbi:LuxR C-terminal-related transcriptional regulator [Sphaerimonospora cavernae]|uniref:LuxR C-terminal-related transcriptional regulator n=1 Tax=Sphaerimonospora cavernae TaxID=1740611 RepID=A0ABV6U668_9ACTN
MLKLQGLDSTSEAVYRTMLRHPRYGAAALAQSLGLTEDVVTGAMKKLSNLALIRPSTNSDVRVQVVSPLMDLEALLSRQQADLADQQRRIEESRAAVTRLISVYAAPCRGPVQSFAEQLVGVQEVRDLLALLTEQVKEEVLTFAPGGPQTQENMSASRPLNRRLLQRGVRMRTIYLDSIRNCKHTVEHSEWLTEQGGEVRTVPSLPIRMIILDRLTAVVASDSDDSSQGAVLLTGQGTLTALCAFFESVWATGRPLGIPGPRDVNGLTSQEKAALNLLAAGLTDEAVSKRLGVSPRTARRISSDLVERLGARSRFQAGVLAARQGWL